MIFHGLFVFNGGEREGLKRDARLHTYGMPVFLLIAFLQIFCTYGANIFYITDSVFRCPGMPRDALDFEFRPPAGGSTSNLNLNGVKRR